MLLQKRVVRTNFDIYVLITINESIPLLVDYPHSKNLNVVVN